MRVKFKETDTMFITEVMKKWIEDHKDRIYVVEQEEGSVVKLKGVGFWITKNLLEEVFEKNQKV